MSHTRSYVQTLVLQLLMLSGKAACSLGWKAHLVVVGHRPIRLQVPWASQILSLPIIAMIDCSFWNCKPQHSPFLSYLCEMCYNNTEESNLYFGVGNHPASKRLKWVCICTVCKHAPVCMCICVSVCLHVHLCEIACLFLCIWTHVYMGNDLKVPSSLFFETGSHTALGLDNKNKTDWSVNSREHLPFLPQMWILSTATTTNS